MDIRIPELNQVLIAGRLTRDPELRFTQKGLGVASFSLAANRPHKDPVSGEWKDDTTYISVNVWGEAAERCKDKLKKGSPVMVEGRLINAEYTDKAGQKRKEIKINARRVQSLAKSGPEAGEVPPAREVEEKAGAEPGGGASGIEEIPF
ncbi:MAG TPA: single-stranded DNA-binding protein [Elusimicrobia bacterium]|nr:single-stranded DNA-binding protein [Elusimicrobiota bacterium]